MFPVVIASAPNGGPAFAGNSGRNTANACEANAMETTTVTAVQFMVGALIRFPRHDKYNFYLGKSGLVKHCGVAERSRLIHDALNATS